MIPVKMPHASQGNPADAWGVLYFWGLPFTAMEASADEAAVIGEFMKPSDLDGTSARFYMLCIITYFPCCGDELFSNGTIFVHISFSLK